MFTSHAFSGICVSPGAKPTWHCVQRGSDGYEPSESLTHSVAGAEKEKLPVTLTEQVIGELSLHRAGSAPNAGNDKQDQALREAQSDP